MENPSQKQQAWDQKKHHNCHHSERSTLDRPRRELTQTATQKQPDPSSRALLSTIKLSNRQVQCSPVTPSEQIINVVCSTLIPSAAFPAGIGNANNGPGRRGSRTAPPPPPVTATKLASPAPRRADIAGSPARAAPSPRRARASAPGPVTGASGAAAPAATTAPATGASCAGQIGRAHV